MRAAVLLLVVGLALAGLALPAASACPDPDNPCTPEPPCGWGAPPATKDPVGFVKACLSD